jgi:hypothetical protein
VDGGFDETAGQSPLTGGWNHAAFSTRWAPLLRSVPSATPLAGCGASLRSGEPLRWLR